MSENSKIQWTDHTFNPWWGCVKVSPGCANCYAEGFAKRTGNKVWGSDAPRRFFGEKHWAEPLKWNAAAEKEGVRKRVFCASMADVFEDRPDLEEHRFRLFELIDSTQWLDWLLLTKRPENVEPLMAMITNGNFGEIWNFRDHLPNVWLGTTVENQDQAEKRIPELDAIPATVRFLSCEPLLGPVNLSMLHGCVAMPECIDWVICGGESGPQARPMELEWARRLYADCFLSGVPFFMKQLGGNRKHHGDLEDFPEDLRVREFPRQ